MLILWCRSIESAAQDTGTTRTLYRHDQLSRLLNPASIAIVGASPRPGSFGERVARNLEHYSGRLYLINPRYDRIGNTPCHPSLAMLPEVPDCIVIVSPAESVEPTVAEAIALGIGGVGGFAAGFAETGKPENILQIGRAS